MNNLRIFFEAKNVKNTEAQRQIRYSYIKKSVFFLGLPFCKVCTILVSFSKCSRLRIASNERLVDLFTHS